MANRHKMHRKSGGRVVYSGAGSNVAKEAEEMKRGGGTKDAGKVHGSKGKHRIHKKRGGSVGADSHPFSSAYSAKTEAK